MTRQQKAILREWGYEGIPWYKCQLRRWRRPSLIRRFDHLGFVFAILIAGEGAVISIILGLIELGVLKW